MAPMQDGIGRRNRDRGLIFGAGFAILGYCPGTTAGAVGSGTYVNRATGRKCKPGGAISRKEFMNGNPDFLFISAFRTLTVEDTLSLLQRSLP